MYVGAKVIDPELLGSGCFAGRLTVKEEDVRFYSLGIEKTRWEAK